MVFGEVDHTNFTHAAARLAGDLVVEGLRASEDPWIASMSVAAAPVALKGGGFGVRLQTTTSYDAEILEEIAGPTCRGLTVELAGRAALHPSVEGVVARLSSGAMARSVESL